MLCSMKRRLSPSVIRVAGAFLFGGSVMSAPLAAQQPEPVLTLQDAIHLARQNNPAYQAQRNNVDVASAAVREAYGGLLPGASASTSFSYQAAGTPRFGMFSGSDLGISNTPAYYSSDYSIGLNYTLSGATLAAPGREKASRRAVEANLVVTEFALHADVTGKYLAVARAADGVVLAQEELKRAEENLKLAAARVSVGAAIPLEEKQAEVERGRARVALLQSENLVRTERLRLAQSIGIELPANTQLTTRFDVFDLTLSQEELIRNALDAHPTIRAARANEQASDAGVRAARSSYLPNMDFSVGLSGYSREAGNTTTLIENARGQMQGQRNECMRMNLISAGLTTPLPGYPQDCSAFQLTAEMERQLISSNDVFPFNYTRQPLGATLRFSLPIFNGFSRERQIEQARAASADARFQTRTEELRLRTEVATAYLNVTTAEQSVELEEANRQLAADQLELARERYRVGVASFLELQDAETIKARADRAYLNAVYAFHEGIAALEQAVGRNLRETR